MSSAVGSELFSPALIALPVAAGLALLVAAQSDVRRYEIPDGCAILIAATAAAFSLVHGWGDLLCALAAGIAIFALGAALFARGWLGGGDVKLLAAIALWVPQSLAAPFALVTSLSGALLSLAFLTPLRSLLPAAPSPEFSGSDAAAVAPSPLRQPVPFGVAIAAGAFSSFTGAWPADLESPSC